MIGRNGRTPQVLLVEDDVTFRASLAALARAAGFAVLEAGDLRAARAVMDEASPDLVVLDLELPDGHGLDLKLSSSLPPETPFIVVSGDATQSARTNALRRGAADYLTKPIDPPAFDSVLHAVRAGSPLRARVADLRASLREAGRFGRLVGRSAPMQRVYDLIARVSQTSVPVLVFGESGTGKELVARTIHDMSPRDGGPFVDVNCGAIPETLIESKLFGHEKGAFTGAERRQRGVFELADGGTLLLDEIGEMPAELQVRLLRVLETSSFTRIGGSEPLSVDVRIIAATNRDPRRAIEEGRLREDLFHRLNVFPIEVPPLRDRREDIELLARYFLDAINAAESTSKRLGSDALALLELSAGSGNVRELRNTIQRAWILSDDLIGADEIAPDAAAPDATTIGAVAFGGDGDAAPASLPAEGLQGRTLQIPVGTPVAEAERQLVLATLEACAGNKRKTAKVLGISVRTLYARLERYAKSQESE